MILPAWGRSAALALLVAAGLGACMTSADSITDRPWKLVEINGSVPGAEAGISFGADGRFTVMPGCNSGGGTYAIDGNRIVAGPAGLTKKACAEPANGQERAFLAVLGATPRFEIETQTGRLRLVAGDASLVFVTP